MDQGINILLKKYFSIFLFIFIAVPAYTYNDFALNLNSGYIGFGGIFPLSDEYNGELTFSLLSIGAEHKPTRIGFEFSPYKRYYFTNTNGVNDNRNNHSFINLNIYWNIPTPIEEYLYFGPFADISYLFIGENVYLNRYIFTTGFNIGLNLDIGRLRYRILSTEIGYRNINGTSKYFIGAKVDLIPIALLIIFAMVSH